MWTLEEDLLYRRILLKIIYYFVMQIINLMFICTINLNVSSRVLGLKGKEHLQWCCKKNNELYFSLDSELWVSLPGKIAMQEQIYSVVPHPATHRNWPKWTIKYTCLLFQMWLICIFTFLHSGLCFTFFHPLCCFSVERSSTEISSLWNWRTYFIFYVKADL